jgi:hypothetical protein
VRYLGQVRFLGQVRYLGQVRCLGQVRYLGQSFYKLYIDVFIPQIYFKNSINSCRYYRHCFSHLLFSYLTFAA